MNENIHKILLVDDEEDVLEFLSYNLKKEGYEVFTAKNGKEAILIAERNLPHLILLDVMMPEMDGIETCQKLRAIPHLKNIIIAFLTARGEDYSQIAGFESGGDDYITKPIKPGVLISRIKALLKRYSKLDLYINNLSNINDKIIDYDDIIIDTEKHIVVKSGKDVNLPKKEFELLMLLVSKPSKVFSRDEIFDKIWGNDVIIGDRTIDVHIRKLREKIGDEYIKTVKGIGYKFEV